MKILKLFYIIFPFFLVSCMHSPAYRNFSSLEEYNTIPPEERPRGYWLSGTFIPEQKGGAINDFFGNRDNLVSAIMIIGGIDAMKN